jgi:ribokinase
MGDSGLIVVLGVFVADTAYRAPRPPRLGETIMGTGFALGPGGKGSNQAVAAARLGAEVSLISKLGDDPFAEMAMRTWAEAGVAAAVTKDPASYTGAAYIFVDDATGENAIIVCPGAGATLAVEDIDANIDLIRAASVFITQLEQPIDAAAHALAIAKEAGVTTLLNPAPAMPIDERIFGLCDYITPNETEAEELTGIEVASLDDAQTAADALLAKGVRAAVITLGEAGALYQTAGESEVEPLEAVRFGCAVAGISVTRPGTAPSMPSLAEVERVLASGE